MRQNGNNCALLGVHNLVKPVYILFNTPALVSYNLVVKRATVELNSGVSSNSQTGGTFLLSRGIPGNFPAVHGELSVPYPHAAAAVLTGSGITGYFAIFHGKLGIVLHIHTAAFTIAVGRVTGNRAILHNEGTVIPHYIHTATAGRCCIVFNRTIFHSELAVIHKYASATTVFLTHA